MYILDVIEGLRDTFLGKGMKYLSEFKVKNTFCGGNEFNPEALKSICSMLDKHQISLVISTFFDTYTRRQNKKFESIKKFFKENSRKLAFAWEESYRLEAIKSLNKCEFNGALKDIKKCIENSEQIHKDPEFRRGFIYVNKSLNSRNVIKCLKKQVNDNEIKIKSIKMDLIKKLKKSNKKIGYELEKEIFNFKNSLADRNDNEKDCIKKIFEDEKQACSQILFLEKQNKNIQNQFNEEKKDSVKKIRGLNVNIMSWIKILDNYNKCYRAYFSSLKNYLERINNIISISKDIIFSIINFSGSLNYDVDNKCNEVSNGGIKFFPRLTLKQLIFFIRFFINFLEQKYIEKEKSCDIEIEKLKEDDRKLKSYLNSSYFALC